MRAEGWGREEAGGVGGWGGRVDVPRRRPYRSGREGMRAMAWRTVCGM